MKRALRNNGLSLAMFGLFALSIVGQSIVGEREFNDDQRAHSQPTVDFFGYLRTGHFVEAIFEDWQSEFLSVGAVVILSVFLRQRGSPGAKPVADPHDETGE